MKNAQQRLSVLSNVFFNMTLCLLFAIFAFSYLKGFPEVHAEMELIRYNPRSEYKMLIFKPNLDLTPQFTFNTKQIFLYVVLDSGHKSEMVWSKIIKRGDDYILYTKQSNNYSFTGTKDNLIKLELRGNIFPFVGQMKDVHYGYLNASFN